MQIFIYKGVITMMEFKKIKILVEDGPFTIVKVQNPIDKKEQLVYVSHALDLSKDSWTWEELRPIWW